MQCKNHGNRTWEDEHGRLRCNSCSGFMDPKEGRAAMQERGTSVGRRYTTHATYDKRGAGEAIDEVIIELSTPVIQLLISTVLAVGSVFLVFLASGLELQSDSSSDDGFAEFSLAVGGLLGVVSLVLYVVGLIGLIDGFRSLRARAQSRSNHWRLAQVEDDN